MPYSRVDRCTVDSSSVVQAKLVFTSVVLILAASVAAENDPILQPECDNSKTVGIRHSSTSKRLYLEAAVSGDRGGCATLSDIFEAQAGQGPLYAVDPETGNRVDEATGTWLLAESLYVEDGITLNVHGGNDGDTDELRILSDTDNVLNLRGYGGSLSFLNTKVFSWDEAAGAYDEDHEDGRSYISVVSEVITDSDETCEGRAKNNMGEARMDIINSEIGYLGYQASESYGLTWKVRGFCTDKSNEDIFEDVNVYGNIYDSDIHHNYFGVYTYGHQQGDWRRNKMHDNVQYGFDPHDDSDFINIHDNEVWGNGNHGIIASKRCNGLSIQNNEVYDGGETGLFLHRSSDDAIVKGNYVHDNGDAGLAMLESFRADVSDNLFENNLNGIRLSVGCADNVFSHNVVSGSIMHNFFTYEGSDAPEVVDSGRSQNNQFVANEVSGGEETIKLKESDGTVFQDNEFSGATTIRFDDATGMLMVGNTGLDDAELELANGACFDTDSDEGYEPTC